jgi:hypothetical protein
MNALSEALWHLSPFYGIVIYLMYAWVSLMILLASFCFCLWMILLYCLPYICLCSYSQNLSSSNLYTPDSKYFTQGLKPFKISSFSHKFAFIIVLLPRIWRDILRLLGDLTGFHFIWKLWGIYIYIYIYIYIILEINLKWRMASGWLTIFPFDLFSRLASSCVVSPPNFHGFVFQPFFVDLKHLGDKTKHFNFNLNFFCQSQTHRRGDKVFQLQFYFFCQSISTQVRRQSISTPILFFSFLIVNIFIRSS